MKRVFISWTPPVGRSSLLVHELKAKSYYISYLGKKKILYTLLRYLIASLHTSYILLSEKPGIVLSINQPVFLPMLVYIYSRLRRCHYVIDSHSGLFNKCVWRLFIPVMKKIYRGCSLNIAHNSYDAEIYKSWGIVTMVLGTEFYSDVNYKRANLMTLNNVVVIASFAPDEPIHEILLAARDLSDVNFYITGRVENAKGLAIMRLPKNVILTGFLPRDEYIGLVKSADAAMVLVKTDNTMQMGAWEALSCGTPLIISSWLILRETFPRGAVFVENSKSGITDGVRGFFEKKEQLRREIIQLRAEKSSLWDKEVASVRDFIDSLK